MVRVLDAATTRATALVHQRKRVGRPYAAPHCLRVFLAGIDLDGLHHLDEFRPELCRGFCI
jgi:hypothetical protein